MLLFVAIALLVAPSMGGRLPNYRIIGGEAVEDISEFPFQGSLRYFGSHSCGCALISATWAVTAAHCVGGPNSYFEVMFGSTDRRSDSVTRTPTNIIIHDSWQIGSGAFPNDIAVINFDAVDLVDGEVETIGLPFTGQNFEGEKGWISGWGYTTTGEGGFLPRILQKAEINIYTHEECEYDWGSSINDGHVCVGVHLDKGSCNGDSGGPLVNSAKTTLVGITSWGIQYCYVWMPSVYTRIDYYREWIQTTTGV